MYRVFFISPIFAAVAFAIPESYQLMHKPDSIYIPVIFELLLFGVGYVVFGIINAIIIVPLCVGLASLTLSRIAGFVLAIAVAALGTYLVYAVEFFGHKPSIMHRAYIFGAFLPLLLTTTTSFYFLTKHRSSMAETSNVSN